jgi:hypothetical protein
MKQMFCVVCAALMALGLLSGCAKEPNPPRPTLTGPVTTSSGTAFSEEECREIAAALYPEGTTLSFEKMEDLFGATALIYHVSRQSDGLVVGRVAVSSADGSVYFWNMGSLYPASGNDPSASKGGWLPAEAFIAARPDELPAAYYDLTLDVEDLTGLSDRLFFAHLTDFEALLPQCEGRAFWREDEHSLELALTVVTGSLEGQPAGPGLSLLVHWVNGVPEVALKVFTPAPMFTDPAEVLSSGEVRELSDEQIIELATFLRDKILALKSEMA